MRPHTTFGSRLGKKDMPESKGSMMRKVLYILGELDDLDLQWLLDAGTTLNFAAGNEIIREDVVVENVFVVIDGELTVSRKGVDIACLGAGEIVGEMSMLDSRGAAATVRASAESNLLAIPRESLQSKLLEDARFASRFYRALCVFLANRLGRTALLVSDSSKSTKLEDIAEVNDLSPDALQASALAGARFDWFISNARGR